MHLSSHGWSSRKSTIPPVVFEVTFSQPLSLFGKRLVMSYVLAVSKSTPCITSVTASILNTVVD